MTTNDFESCSYDKDCRGFKQSGRAVYLLLKERKDKGFCKECEDFYVIGGGQRSQEIDVKISAKFGDSIANGSDLDMANVEFGTHKFYNTSTNPLLLMQSTVASIKDDNGSALANGSHANFVNSVASDAMLYRLDTLAQMAYVPSVDSPFPEPQSDPLKREDFLKSEWAAKNLYNAAGFTFNQLVGVSGDIEVSEKDIFKTQGWNGYGYLFELISDAEAREIFGDMNPTELVRKTQKIHAYLSETHGSAVKDPVFEATIDPNNDRDLGGKSSHAYFHNLNEAVYATHKWASEEGVLANSIALQAEGFIAEVLEAKMGEGKTREEALAFLLANSSSVDDFMWNSEALYWKVMNSGDDRTENYRKKEYEDEIGKSFKKAVENGDEDAILKNSFSASVNDILTFQNQVLQYTQLLDKRWRAELAKDPIEAMKRRFGHPVGIPTNKLKPWHFMPGGELVECGWVDLIEGSEYSFNVNMPVDVNGKAVADTHAWDNVRPTVSVRSLKTPEGLSDLARATASAKELWAIKRNEGLPKDSLYTAATLSNVDARLDGSGWEGTGEIMPILSPSFGDIEMAKGKGFIRVPTLSGKITALSRDLVGTETGKSLFPRGSISLHEIEIGNYRIAQMSDNMLSNEYGLVTKDNNVNGLPEGAFLGTRETAEAYSKEVKSWADKPEENSFISIAAVNGDDFLRPILGQARPDTQAMFFSEPGLYMRRCGGMRPDRPTPAKAFLEHIKAPLTPSAAMRDTLTGEATGGCEVYEMMPGHGTLFPHKFFTPTRSELILEKPESGPLSLVFKKVMHQSPGRYKERSMKRWRFAAVKTFGEKAGPDGLIDPNVFKPEDILIATSDIHGPKDVPVVIPQDKPEFNKILEKAKWHNSALYMHDFEAGEMGATYRRIPQDETARKKYLQAMSAGKQFRQTLDTQGFRDAHWITRSPDGPGLPEWKFGPMSVPNNFSTMPQKLYEKIEGTKAPLEARTQGGQARDKHPQSYYGVSNIEAVIPVAGKDYTKFYEEGESILGKEAFTTQIKAHMGRKGSQYMMHTDQGLGLGAKGGFGANGWEDVKPLIKIGKGSPEAWSESDQKEWRQSIESVLVNGRLEGGVDIAATNKSQELKDLHNNAPDFRSKTALENGWESNNFNKEMTKSLMNYPQYQAFPEKTKFIGQLIRMTQQTAATDDFYSVKVPLERRLNNELYRHLGVKGLRNAVSVPPKALANVGLKEIGPKWNETMKTGEGYLAFDPKFLSPVTHALINVEEEVVNTRLSAIDKVYKFRKDELAKVAANPGLGRTEADVRKDYRKMLVDTQLELEAKFTPEHIYGHRLVEEIARLSKERTGKARGHETWNLAYFADRRRQITRRWLDVGAPKDGAFVSLNNSLFGGELKAITIVSQQLLKIHHENLPFNKEEIMKRIAKINDWKK
ncbi:MAG: hypothetical protein EOP06_03235 [Proteobacteria bacterium]|nr:MAG: hypothetical protein EOP06_03235 [Pseudomonadota bacterium]